jgi:acetyltransferase-like isoleucine patch superfamily enzyme
MSAQFVHPTAFVDPAAQLSPDTIVESGCLIRPEVQTSVQVRIGAGTHISGRVTIAPRVTIWKGVTIIGPLEIKEDVVIGSRAVLGVEVAVVDSQLECGSIGAGARIGKDSIVLGRLLIGAFARLLPGTRLEGDLPDHGLAVGAPAALQHFICECGRPYRYYGTSGLIHLARCPYCSRENRIIHSDLEKVRHILLPNGQPGPDMPAWYPSAVLEE